MNAPPKAIPITLKVLGIVWFVSGAYLLYGACVHWFMYANTSARNPELYPSLVPEAIFFSVYGILALVVAGGMFRPYKYFWWLAVLLCPGTSWWFLSKLPGLLLHGPVLLLLIFLSYLALLAFSLGYLLLPFQRHLFGIGKRPTMQSSDLPPADAVGSRSLL